MNITYSKLRDGSWGMRGPKELLIEGQKVSVTKKSGEKKEETVGKILWEGKSREEPIIDISIAKIADIQIQMTKKFSNSCECDDSACCSSRCQCEKECNCRGGQIYNC